jgi:hypothetical protein
MLAALGAAPRAPALLPPGWTARPVEGDPTVIRYVSPDQRAVLTLRDVSRSSRALPAASDHAGEMVTYRQRGRDWNVVSGYRGDEIFYRRVTVACGGTRVHTIELVYPRSDKRKMDAIVTRVSHRLQRYNEICPNAK